MLAPSLDENGDVTTPARIALAALEKLIEGREYGDVQNEYRAIFQFCTDIETEINAAHVSRESARGEARHHFNEAQRLDDERKRLTALVSECHLELACLVTAAQAVCARLDDFDPTELIAELTALKEALCTKRIQQVVHFMNYSILARDLESTLRHMFHRLNAKPKITDAAVKYMFDQLKRLERPWWKIELRE
jgi:hypothetical protein